MNLTETKFSEITECELNQVSGGGVFDFVGDIYDGWCEMWHDFGTNLYHMIH